MLRGTKEQIKQAEQIKGRMINTLLFHTPQNNYLTHKLNMTLRNEDGTWYSLHVLIKRRSMIIGIPKYKLMIQLFRNIIESQKDAKWFLERQHFRSGGHLIGIIASQMTPRRIENYLMMIFDDTITVDTETAT